MMKYVWQMRAPVGKDGTALTIALDQVVVENTLLDAIIVGSIYFERWLEEKARRRKERKTKKDTINFIMNDLENKLPSYTGITSV
jgi:hypothetical protein